MKKGIKFSDLSVLNFILFFIFYLVYAREEGIKVGPNPARQLQLIKCNTTPLIA